MKKDKLRSQIETALYKLNKKVVRQGKEIASLTSSEAKKRLRKIRKETEEKKQKKLLCKYAIDCKFIMETGAGKSTVSFAKLAKITGAKVVSIEINKESCIPLDGVEYKVGWSITYDDIIKPGNPYFIDVKRPSPRKLKEYIKKYPDAAIAHGAKHLMTGKTDLIRKTLAKTDMPLDFFFCDTGEYCGLAEWNIVKNIIPVGGYFAIHDVQYPHSIKGFQVLEQVEKDDAWEIMVHTKRFQGLLIARKKH